MAFYTAGDEIKSTDVTETSSGASDSGKGVKLDGDGRFDESVIHVRALDAGETINGATLPVPVVIVSAVHQTQYRSQSLFGDVSGNTRRSVQIKPYAAITSTTLKLLLKKVGSPGDNLTIEIQGDSSGDPDGTAITNGTSNTVAGSGLTTDYAEVTFTFASAFSLSADTVYHIVLKRSGAVDGSNHYKVLSLANDYANFVGKKYNGSAWSSGDLMYAEMIPATGSSLAVWKSDANVLGLHRCDGVAISNSTESSLIEVQLSGVVSGFSGLELGKKYYVQDTVGTIGNSVGTYEICVGESISTTQIVMKKYSGEYRGSLSFSGVGTPTTSACSGEAPMPPDARFVLISPSGSADPNSVVGKNLIVERTGRTSDSNQQNKGATSSASWSCTFANFMVSYSVSSSTQNSSWSCPGTMYVYT